MKMTISVICAAFLSFALGISLGAPQQKSTATTFIRQMAKDKSAVLIVASGEDAMGVAEKIKEAVLVADPTGTTKYETSCV